MDRQGIDSFMGGQTDRCETTQPTGRVPEECTQFPVAFRIGEDEPDIAIKQLHPIIIFCDHHRTSRVSGSADPYKPPLEKDALAQTIDLRNAVGTPAVGAEDTETAEHGK